MTDPRLDAARAALLEGVGREVAASFPGITRLGGQVVAALYLAEGPRTMDQLAAELGCAKSNVFSNVRALEAAQIVERRREPGARHDQIALRGPYPDVVVGAYLSRLRLVITDKRELVRRSLELLGDAPGPEAERLRERLGDLGRKYALFGLAFDQLLPGFEGPLDLEAILRRVPAGLVQTVTGLARAATALFRPAGSPPTPPGSAQRLPLGRARAAKKPPTPLPEPPARARRR